MAKGKVPPQKRLSIPIGSGLEEAINEIAAADGTSLAKAAERMLRTGVGYEALRIQGGEIIHRDPSGKEKVLADGTSSPTFRLPWKRKN